MKPSRRELELRIAELESEVEHFRKRSVFLDKAKLPPCKALYCTKCDNAFYYEDFNGRYLLGCLKDINCPDFKLKTTTESRTNYPQLFQPD